MKANFYIENQRFCLAFDKYVIEEINGKRYIIPEKGAKSRVSTFSDWIDRYMIDILNIGKKVYYNEEVEDIEILDYVKSHGLFGFMADFPVNRYYVLDDTVALRDYNLIEYEDHITNMDLREYLKFFMPKLNDKQIEETIEKCRNDISPRIMEKYLTPELNEFLIFSKHYGEPVDMILQYAKILYEHLVHFVEKRTLLYYSPLFSVHNLSVNIDHLHNNEVGLIYGYLKQAIDLNFIVNLSQDTVMLKICKYCHKAFLPKNSKAEYDTPQCKNKANVYSFRKRAQEE
jgi:hypothetical protein